MPKNKQISPNRLVVKRQIIKNSYFHHELREWHFFNQSWTILETSVATINPLKSLKKSKTALIILTSVKKRTFFRLECGKNSLFNTVGSFEKHYFYRILCFSYQNWSKSRFQLRTIVFVFHLVKINKKQPSFYKINKNN